MHIPKAICVPCQIEMICAKQGVIVEMLLQDYQPYYKISADIYSCPLCGNEVVAAFAREVLAEHFEADYATTFEPTHSARFARP